MKAQIYQLLHVGAGFLLTAYTFQAFAAAAEKRKSLMIKTGILSLLMLVGGFGLQAVFYKDQDPAWPHWMLGKVGCWLVLSAVAGFAFRRPSLRPLLALVATLAVLGALYLVYFRPEF